eukprot:6461609-Amphidinium_carterae.1
MVYNNFAIPTTFIILDVNYAILGLDTVIRNGLCLTVDGYRSYLGNDQAEVQLRYTGNRFYFKATMFDSFRTTLTTPRTLRVGTMTGMRTSNTKAWSTDYIKKIYSKFQSMETTYLEISHNKKQAYHVHSKHQLLLHKKKSTNTTSLTCHIATGANTVYKEKTDNNITIKVDYVNRALPRSTTRSSRATTTSTMLQC